MAINVTKAPRPDPAPSNLRETRANRAEQRSEAAGTRRAAQDDAVLKQRVKENSEATRNQARANDEAAATARRAAQQADKKADTQRRDNEKTLGRHIDTTA